MKKLIFAVGVILFVAVGALIYYGKKSSQISMASAASTICDEEEVRKTFRGLMENWASFPSYVAVSIAHSAYACLGPIGYDAEIEIFRKTAKVTGTDRKKRSIASEDTADYKKWRATHDALDTLATTFKATGGGFVSMGAIPSPASPSLLVVGAGVTAVGFGIDQIGKATGAVASQYAMSLSRKGFDLQALESAREKGRSQEERRALLKDELMRQSSGMTDASQFSDSDAVRALDKGLGNAVRYSGYLAEKIEANQADANQLKDGFVQLEKKAADQAQKIEQKMSNVNESLSALSEDIKTQGQSNADFMNLMLSMNNSNMSAENKLYAIEKLNYGNYEGTKKEQEIQRLQRFVKIENMQNEFNHANQYVGEVGTILNNLGIKNEFINSVVEGAQKANTAVNGLSSVLKGDYLGGLATFSGIFGGGGDPGHAQIVAMLQQVIELQKKTIELQIETMKMIEGLSHQIADGVAYLDAKIKQVLTVESLLWEAQYQRDFENDMRICGELRALVRRRLLEDSVANEPELIAHLNERQHSGIRLADQIAQSATVLPVADIWSMHRILQSAENEKIGVEDCITRLENQLLNIRSFDSTGLNGIAPHFKATGRAIAQNLKSSDLDAVLTSLSDQYLIIDGFLSSSGLKDKNGDVSDLLLKSALLPAMKYSEVLDKQDRIGSLSLPENEEFHLPMFKRDLFQSDVILDPIAINETLRFYFELAPLHSYMHIPQKGFSSTADVTNESYELKIQNLRDLVVFMIAQQSIVNSEAVLPQLSEKFTFPDATQKNATVLSRLLRGETQAPPEEYAYFWVTHSPFALRNVLRYRLSRAFRGRPWSLYSITYQYANDVKEGEAMLNAILQNEKIQATRDTEGRLKLGFRSETAGADKLKQLNIELPTPEDFFSDRIYMPPEINALLELREILNAELFYARQQSLGWMSRAHVDQVASELKGMAL